jgi:hypothetical protein
MIRSATKALATIITCILVIVMAGGCNSEKRAAERKAQIEVERITIRREIADVDKKIAELEGQEKAIDQEIKRRETLWHTSVLARHPDWNPEKQKRNIAILDLKWSASNRDEDADTVKEMIIFGVGIGYNEDLEEADYWDVARARHYQLESHDLYHSINKQMEPLKVQKEILLEDEKRLDNRAAR